MANAADPIVGTWTLNPGKSEFDPNHRPTQATMEWGVEADGRYVLRAEGMNAKGEKVAEKPQHFIPDGKLRPVPDLPGLTAVANCPDPNTIRAEVRREDGSLVGEGLFVVSADGNSLTATNSGMDSQLRPFRQFTVWDRR